MQEGELTHSVLPDIMAWQSLFIVVCWAWKI